jgi:hypothetical protein
MRPSVIRGPLDLTAEFAKKLGAAFGRNQIKSSYENGVVFQ